MKINIWQIVTTVIGIVVAFIIVEEIKKRKYRKNQYGIDASFNIGVAVGAINTVGKGVFISMNGRIYAFDKCKRDMKTGQFIDA